MSEGDSARLGPDAGAFVGRLVELAHLRARLDEVRAGEPRCVLVEGPAGIGKTALVQRFLADATDLRLLRASGELEEHLLPYGVAQQLATSARVTLAERLATLGPSSSSHPEPFAIGTDFVELLGTLQADGPVVVVIDDVQWADRPSLLAILFALRRLEADRVLTVLVARDRDKGRLPEGLVRLCSGERGVTLHLAGLEASELQKLAAEISGKSLPPEMAERLRDHTGGSPLHFRALLEELPPERLRHIGDAPLPCPRPFSMQVLSRLSSCPPEAQRLVVAASILGEESQLALVQRVACVADPLLALEQAIAASLLEGRHVAGEQGLAFPHGLIRAAIYHDVGPSRRATLHLRAAEHVGDEAASLRHRSAAAVGEDDALAGDLAEYAQREQARGAWSRAAAALLRASHLTSSRDVREQRLMDGVDCLLVAGEIPRAAALTHEVKACEHAPNRDYLLGRLAQYQGRLREAHGLLLSAWDRCDAEQDADLASRVAAALAIVVVRRARGPELVTWARLAAQAGGAALPHSTLACGLAYSGRPDEALAELTSLPESPEKLSADDLDAFAARGVLRFMTDDLAGARADFSLVARDAAHGGPFFLRFVILTYQSVADYRIGDWDAAVAHAESAVSIAEATDQNWVLSWMHAAASTPLTARGQWPAAEAHVRAALDYAREVDDENSVADAAMAEALLAAARGDHQAVISALGPILGMSQREGIDEPGSRWPWQELYADALVGVDRPDEADAVLTPFEECAAARARRSALTNAARVRGNLEAARRRYDLAEAAFRAGLAHSMAVQLPFDRARLEEAYGRFQRRVGRRASAIGHLKAALSQFTQLGANPYSERCERVLNLCGVVAEGRAKQRTSLTPPEVAVARLVAGGLSNREVAAQLVVSVNTVEFHLKNIYAKLGIFSRRQLALSSADEIGAVST